MSVFDAMFGCGHDRTTFPLTPKRGGGKGAYVACLDCGREFPYNWQEMRMEEVKSVPAQSHVYTKTAHTLSRLLRFGS